MIFALKVVIFTRFPGHFHMSKVYFGWLHIASFNNTERLKKSVKKGIWGKIDSFRSGGFAHRKSIPEIVLHKKHYFSGFKKTAASI